MGSNGILAFGAPLPNRRRKTNLGPTNGTNTPPGRDLMVKQGDFFKNFDSLVSDGSKLFLIVLRQVNNWFINARRRILQPMMENDNKKKKTWSSENLTDQQSTSTSQPANTTTNAQEYDKDKK